MSKNNPPSEIIAWQMTETEAPLVKRSLPVPELKDDDLLIEVAGCGLCHTDLSFLYGGVKTKKALPLTLGHEFTGRVVATGSRYEEMVGKSVLVPAVLPCGECELCKAGRDRACRNQVMPGNDLDGGFASHAVLPGRWICPVEPGDFDLWQLGVVADAVTTPYQAAEIAKVDEADTVVVIGVGGIGSYGVQVCAARGAKVIAVDIDQGKLDTILEYGATAAVNVKGLDGRAAKDAVRSAAKESGLSRFAWKVFEMSGTGNGQALAYDLLTFAGTVGFIGFSRDKTNVRLGNLMAFDAQLFGNWGCSPKLYPAALDLVLSGKVKIKPFIRSFALDEINDVLTMSKNHQIAERPVLVP
jgi:6-hydroxycyclohex-1-ene-1-carbonyl-CoA dehydrogenase